MSDFTIIPFSPIKSIKVSLELAYAYSLDTVVIFSLGKEVHDPSILYLHATLLYQFFTYYKKFLTLLAVEIWAMSQS